MEPTDTGRANPPTQWPAPAVIKDCTQCGAAFAQPKGGRRGVCSNRCRNRRNRRQKSPEQKAAENARYRALRVLAPDLTCEGCGKQYGNHHRERNFCSHACYIATMPRVEKFPPPTPIVVLECLAGCGKLRTFPARRQRWRCSADCGRTRQCESCGDPFVLKKWQGGQQRFCSATCTRRESKTRRRARKMKAPGMAPVFRAKIYERDGWRCQICRRLVKRGAMPPHPKAPTLDHIIPLAAGGSHEPANVQLACFRCNCTKCAGTAPSGDQLRLIG